jgi:very-short-patch-repair endonuclease
VLTVRDVIAALARSPRHPGAPRLAALASAERPASTETRSRNEERLLRLVRSGGLPLPELNVPVGPYIVDALWRDLRLVVEVDSYEYHGTRWSFEADRARDLALGTTGYRVIRFTADQVEHRAAWVLVNLAQELTRRPPHHG